jgi:hypothetical protein
MIGISAQTVADNISSAAMVSPAEAPSPDADIELREAAYATRADGRASGSASQMTRLRPLRLAA